MNKIYTVEISADYGLRTLRGSFETNRDNMSCELYWYKSVVARNMMEAEKKALITLVKERNQFERELHGILALLRRNNSMILNNLMQAVKKLEHIRDMVKALVLTGFKQGKVEFTDADVIAIKQVIAFIKMGTLPEQITAQINEVASPDEDTQEPASPLPPIETVKEIIHRQLLPIIEEFDIGDGQKRQVIITPESVSDSGKEPKTHILVEDPGDDWKDGLE